MTHFLDLPTEIRSEIYVLVLTDEMVIHKPQKYPTNRKLRKEQNNPVLPHSIPAIFAVCKLVFQETRPFLHTCVELRTTIRHYRDNTEERPASLRGIKNFQRVRFEPGAVQFPYIFELELQRFPQMQHVTLEARNTLWSPHDIGFNKPIDPCTGAHHGAADFVRFMDLQPLLSRVMLFMRRSTEIKKGSSNCLTVTLELYEFERPMMKESGSEDDLVKLVLTLDNNDVSRLWYKFGGQQYNVVQRQLLQ